MRLVPVPVGTTIVCGRGDAHDASDSFAVPACQASGSEPH